MCVTLEAKWWYVIPVTRCVILRTSVPRLNMETHLLCSLEAARQRRQRSNRFTSKTNKQTTVHYMHAGSSDRRAGNHRTANKTQTKIHATYENDGDRWLTIAAHRRDNRTERGAEQSSRAAAGTFTRSDPRTDRVACPAS